MSGIADKDRTTSAPRRWFDPLQDAEVDVLVAGKEIERLPHGGSHVLVTLTEAVCTSVDRIVKLFVGAHLKERV
jgi:hypothetical protein